jgi:hypothetical protein
MENGRSKKHRLARTLAPPERDRSPVAAAVAIWNPGKIQEVLAGCILLRAGTARAPAHGIARRFVATPVCRRSCRNPRVSTCCTLPSTRQMFPR